MKALLPTSGLLLLLLLSLAGQAQYIELSTKSKKAVKHYQTAETAFRQQDFATAASDLNKAVRADDQFIEAWLLLGDTYREMDEKELALESFNTAISIDSSFFPRAYYLTGNLYYELGAYENAADQYAKLLLFLPQPSSLKTKVISSLQRALFASEAIRNPVDAIPLNTGGLINSPNDDYINYISVGKDELVMTRKQPIRVDQFNRVIYKEGFYQASKEKDEWLEPDTLKLGWDEGLNLGGMNISVDGRKMYFTGCNWPGGFGSCDLYVSFKSGDKWEQPSNLGTRVNSQWWDSQPFISSNGKQLLFASKRAGGKGNTDIWMSVRQPGGKWSMPINLGDSINTPGSEMAPFLHPDGMTLYFASDGHDGLGGYDLFVSRKDETGRWSKAMNLGYPVNSMKNEINMVVDLHGESAWLSSDREGGEGKTDIYFFETYEAIKPQQVSFVKGQVLDEVTRRPLQAFVELSNLATGLNEDSTFTDRINGGFLMVLDPGLNYAFNIYAEGYMLYSENFNLDRDTADAVEKVFLLKPITAGERITLENVYFDFNSASLLPASFIELDKLSALLKDQPSMRIRIEGHTDDTGTDDYNQKLSEDRAGSVYHYLIENGVGPDRLEWVGFGASRPLTSNSSESGRAKNRRTEIVVL